MWYSSLYPQAGDLQINFQDQEPAYSWSLLKVLLFHLRHHPCLVTDIQAFSGKLPAMGKSSNAVFSFIHAYFVPPYDLLNTDTCTFDNTTLDKSS